MQVLKIDRKNNFIELIPRTLDDFWHLEKVLEKGDIVSAGTERKIKPKEAGQEPFKVNLFLEIELEEVSFEKFSSAMRLSGIIVGGKPEELIELKAHHSISLELNNKLKIQKKLIKDYVVERLRKAEAASKKPKLLIVVLDDERADFASLSDFGLEKKTAVFSGRSGKQYKSEASQKYFDEILQVIKDSKMDKIVVAGPGFTKENFRDYVKSIHSSAGFFFESTNSVGETGLNELLKKDISSIAIQEMEIVKETKLIQDFLLHLGKEDGLIEYGLSEVEKAIDLGAVESLVVSEELLLKERKKIEALFEKAEKLKGKIHIISKDHEAGRQLMDFTGVIAFLRFRVK